MGETARLAGLFSTWKKKGAVRCSVLASFHAVSVTLRPISWLPWSITPCNAPVSGSSVTPLGRKSEEKR